MNFESNSKTVQKTIKLINYLKRTKKADTCDLLSHAYEDEDWNFYFSLNGYFNNSYFDIEISNHKVWGTDKIKIINTTDNVPEIKKLLEKYELLLT